MATDGTSADEQSGEESAFARVDGDLSIRVGREQIDIENRWEAASILNDIMTGLWFLTGSILNMVGDSETLPLAFYLAGSSQLLLRAFIRLARRVHVKRLNRPSRPRLRRPSRHQQT